MVVELRTPSWNCSSKKPDAETLAIVIDQSSASSSVMTMLPYLLGKHRVEQWTISQDEGRVDGDQSARVVPWPDELSMVNGKWMRTSDGKTLQQQNDSIGLQARFMMGQSSKLRCYSLARQFNSN